MNPQFCSPLPLRPSFVPVVVRPTVPVWYTSLTQDHSSPTHGVPLFPFGLTPEANFNSQTTIGVDHSKGKVKQGDTLEDFKKIAERNGITVCAPGSKDQAESGSLFSSMTPPPDNSNIGHSNADHILTSLSRSCGETRESISHSTVGNYYNTPSNEQHVTEAQNPVNAQGFSVPSQVVMETENNSKSSTTDKLSLFKNKAAMSGIKVEEDTDLVLDQEAQSNITPTVVSEGEEPKQAIERPAQIRETATEMTDLAVTNEDRANNLEHALGSSPLGEFDSEVAQLSSEEDEDVEIKPEGETCIGKKSESESKVENQKESACTPGMIQEAEVTNSKDGKEDDNVTAAENTLNAEHVTISLKEDAQIAAFEEIARQKGIKVGNVPKNSTSSVTSPSVRRVETAATVEADGLDASTEQDAQIARFEEMAWLNGIKVGKQKTGRLSASCSESSDSVTPEVVQENEFCTETYSFEEDPQIARFQESAWLRGIKVCGKLSNDSSRSSLSPATSDDYLCPPGYEICEVVAQTKGDTFEELAKRNGIKIGKPVVSSETLNIAGVSADNSHGRLHGNTASSVESMERPSIVFCQASTQTEVTTVDGHSQTCEKDHGLFKQSTQVQVDAFREAFAEEFMMWKLDESAAGDDVELCYKELYFKERTAREELSESLQNEKDVSANTKHNHKRVMEQLKEELSSKTEETEKLKKDLKTLKKQKETEAKRILKELKSKEEELESCKGTLQMKEVAIESLNSIMKEQTEKLQFLRDQMQEMKTALLQVNKDVQCKTCMNSRTENRVTEEINQEEQSGGGWTVYTRRKSKSPPFKPTQVEKAQGRPSPGSVNELCDIELSSAPCLNRPFTGNPGSENKFNSLYSLETEETQVDDSTKCRADCPTTASALQGDMPRSSPQASSYSALQSAEASCSPPVNNVLSPPLSSKAGEELRGSSISQSPPAEEQPSVQNSSALSVDNVLPHNDQHIASKVPNVDAPVSTNTTVSGSTCQQLPLNAFFPAPPFAFQGIPTEVISQYLSSLLVQPNIPPGNNRVRTSSVPLRRPPGLNTEPVPDEEPDQPSPSSPPQAAGKSTFDKLMDALHKRFPNKSRQELVLDLKKAKASTGAAGFKGKQIVDVVKCVENVVKDKQESEVDN